MEQERYERIKKIVEERLLLEEPKEEKDKFVMYDKATPSVDLFTGDYQIGFMTVAPQQRERILSSVAAGGSQTSFKQRIEEYLEKNEQENNTLPKSKKELMIASQSTSSSFYVNLDKPQRSFAIRCALALQLDFEETNQLLSLAGFRLRKYKNDTCPEDIWIYACIKEGLYDIKEINSCLFENEIQTL